MPRGKTTKPAKPAKAKSAVNKGVDNKVWLFAGIVLVLLLSVIGVMYATSPQPIRQPKFDHYHFRLQILVDGKPENFAQPKYQTVAEPGSAASCNEELSDRPVHFHDYEDQFVHIHWDGITGGIVLKNYGWNFIGGSDASLGYRFDNLLKITRVPRYGDVLPQIPEGSNFYVYSGNDITFLKRSLNEFKSQDLETFFGKKSNIATAPAKSLWDRLFPKAYAHGGNGDGHVEDQATLERINNLIGNVVIFVQKDPPTDQQVRDRFQKLEPLAESGCSG